MPGPRGPILVVGYGNPLRSDDAVGPLAASAVAAWGRPEIVAIAAHQLAPELAEPLADARLAIFIDARPADPGEGVRVEPIAPRESASWTGHAGDPRRLLALARSAFGACPRAWLVTVPAPDLGPGDRLSETARRGLEAALRAVEHLAVGGPDNA